MRAEREMTLLENCKIELEEAVDRFELFDYEYLLDIERVALKYMAKYFESSDIAVGNEFIARDINLCLKLLNIATGDLFYAKEDINAPYVNIRNKERFIKHTTKNFDSPAIRSFIREMKAWNLYCKVRSNMQRWWD